jgi:hypothetical protein
MRTLLILTALASLSACAAHAIWLGGHPPLLEDYAAAHVRIYRAGLDCRLEVITATDTIITLPTRCVTVPHVTRP